MLTFKVAALTVAEDLSRVLQSVDEVQGYVLGKHGSAAVNCQEGPAYRLDLVVARIEHLKRKWAGNHL